MRKIAVTALLIGWALWVASATAATPPEYEVDLRAWNATFCKGIPGTKFTWPDQADSIEHAFSVQVDLGEQVITAPTHLFGKSIRLIPYANQDGGEDAAGNHYDACDAALTEYFPPGAIGFGIMNHRPEHRKLSINLLDAEGVLEELKLQDTHILIVVGGQRGKRSTVVAIHNPQDYLEGRFGDANYPMLLVKPVFPAYVDAKTALLLRDNIRTMMVAFNAVSNFPDQYNGGDPLAARDPEHVREHVAMMIRAIAGDPVGETFFKDPENLIYCAELAHIASSAGLLVPLNDTNILPLLTKSIGAERAAKTWAAFREQVRKHNAGEPSRFSEMNKNFLITDIKLADLDTLADLKPAPSYAPEAIRAAEEKKLAFKPMTMADIIEQFLREYIPRERLGEGVAPGEAKIMRQLQPALLEGMALAPTHPQAAAVMELYGRMIAIIGKSHASYAAFRAELDPLMEEARQISGPRGGGAAGLFVPPSLLHVVAAGHYSGGLLGLEYVGHGVHYSLVRPKGTAPAEPPAEPPVKPEAATQTPAVN